MAVEAAISNEELAELLALEAEKVSGTKYKALRRASRAAFLWPLEAVELRQQGRSLQELAAVGPFISKHLEEWIEKPPLRNKSPAIRRNFMTLARARRILDQNPFVGFRGDLQMHTVWSDGAGTVMQMAEAGLERGYAYIGVTDHSKGLRIAGGIDEEALRRQGREIAEVNEQLLARGFQVLRSIELNLSPDGGGDMDEAALDELDLVVGSFHSRLRVQEDQTERYLAALRNPAVTILGHPRGRIYNFRVGLKADWPRVFAFAAQQNKAIEVDSYPDRQDIDPELLKVARDAGVKIAIDTDAHAPEQLGFVELGLASASAARFPTEQIINCMSADELIAWAGEMRERRKAA